MDLRRAIITKLGLNRTGKRRLTFYTEILSRFLSENSRLLDIGCGSGELINILGKRGTLLTIGIDINYESLKIARGLNVVCADAYSLPFRASSFTHVFCISLLEHLRLPQECIVECHRILRYGGYLILQVPNLQYFFEPHTGIPLLFLWRRLKVLALVEPYLGFINFDVSIKNLLSWLRSAGFVIISCLKIYWDLRTPPWPAGWMIVCRKLEPHLKPQ